MPLKADIKDPAGYWNESRFSDSRLRSIGECASEYLERLQHQNERFPVQNREPRTEISSQKRAIIHQRDGGLCVYCFQGWSELTVDHVIPRSSFPVEQLNIADRSDNLVSACWPCNEAKSNFGHRGHKKLGVTVACWDCMNPEIVQSEDHLDRELIPYLKYKAFCGRCGITSSVPELSWIL